MNLPSKSRMKLAARAFLAPLWILPMSGQLLGADPAWLSPSTIIAAPDGRALYVACAAGDRVAVVDLNTRQASGSVAVPSRPTGLAISGDGKTLYVTCGGPQSEVCVVDVEKRRVTTKLAAGHTAVAPVLSPDGNTLYVCNQFNNDVSVFDLAKKRETRRIAVRREPIAAAITLDGRYLLVANHLPAGRADADLVAAVVSVIDTASGQVARELQLPSGSGFLTDLRVSPDGKYAVVTHVLSRVPLPTIQLDRGWMNTNAKTLIALDPIKILNTVLLDTVDRGAANPYAAAWSADSKTVVVALAGTHEVSVTDFPALMKKLDALSAPKTEAGGQTPAYTSASLTPADVPNDLSFLVGVRERRRLPENDLGPRGVVVVGRMAYTANYFSDTVSAVELDGTHPKATTIPLGPKPQMTRQRLGELYFNDARICFQGWQSCATCHPGDARVDGLNWDLLNDGLGNPKNTKSMLLVFKTPPAMTSGVRESAEAAVRAGIRHILFTVQPPEVAEAMDAYIQALQPVPSPHLVKGKLSAAAKRGEKVFNNKEVGCVQCHPGPVFTDLQHYDVGTRGATDHDTGTFDTPTLVELWRTAPYLHNGSAVTLKEVLTTGNKNDHHGKTSHLKPEQIDDLVEYLLSL
jgi:YVTN family beta-propeller protein